MLRITRVSSAPQRHSAPSSRTLSCALGAALVLALGVPCDALAQAKATGPADKSSGNAAISATPSEQLTSTQKVLVEGSGFPAAHSITVMQCKWTPQDTPTKGPENRCRALGQSTTDSDGKFSIAVTVTKTFVAVSPKGESVTFTCAAANDCMIEANNYTYSPQTPPRYARHPIAFAAKDQPPTTAARAKLIPPPPPPPAEQVRPKADPKPVVARPAAGKEVELNPQPEPPSADPKPVVARPAAGKEVELNPQPEPPSKESGARAVRVTRPHAPPEERAGEQPTVTPAPPGPVTEIPGVPLPMAEAKLVTTAVTLQPAQPKAGQQVAVAATVQNQGGLLSESGLTLILLCDQIAGQPSCPKMSFAVTLPSLGPGQSYQTVVPAGAAWQAGKYRLVIGTNVIPANDVVELELVVGPSTR